MKKSERNIVYNKYGGKCAYCGCNLQKDLAERLSASPQQVNKVVKGQENLTLETIAKIEDALGIVLI